MAFVGRKPTNAPLTSDDIPNGIISAADLASGISGLITWQSVQTTGFTASAGRGYPCNTTSAAFTVTLPATPSAGLMLTLGIIDELTENDLTAGKIIAGTGTINYLGEVGPIGGIRQKLEGAQSSGAELFLAPIDNCDEVSSDNHKSMPVVAVSNVTDAIKAIETYTKTGSIKGLKTCS